MGWGGARGRCSLLSPSPEEGVSTRLQPSSLRQGTDCTEVVTGVRGRGTSAVTCPTLRDCYTSSCQEGTDGYFPFHRRKLSLQLRDGTQRLLLWWLQTPAFLDTWHELTTSVYQPGCYLQNIFL